MQKRSFCLPPSFFFSFSLRPRRLLFSLVSGPGCPGPWRSVLPLFLVLFVLSACLVCCLFPTTLLFLFPPPLPFFFCFLFFPLFLPLPHSLFWGCPAAWLSVCSFVFNFFFGVLCCAVGPLHVVPCLWLCRRAALFAL